MSSSTSSSLSPIHVISVGAFGRAVASYLQIHRADLVEYVVSGNTLPPVETWPCARTRVVVAWRPAPRLYALTGEISWRTRLPFVPVVIDTGVLRIGPIVIPPQEGCWSCWVKRATQHTHWRLEHEALQDRYSMEGEIGPKGFLDAFAFLAAARVSDTIEMIDSGRADAGSIWQIDLMTRSITMGKAIGVHGCVYCGLRRQEATRTISELNRELSYLWRNIDSNEKG